MMEPSSLTVTWAALVLHILAILSLLLYLISGNSRANAFGSSEVPLYFKAASVSTPLSDSKENTIAETIQAASRFLPTSMRLPEEIVVELVDHDVLNRELRRLGVPATLMGITTDHGKRIILSELVTRMPSTERNRYILHELWHSAQFASDYHPGVARSELEASAFAESVKDSVGN